MNISLEFFPPANLDFSALLSEYKKLEHLGPSFVSVTYGAGGGAENKSLELIKALKKNNLDIAAHITLVNKSIDDLEKIVLDFAKLGVKKFVALRGDSPEGKFKQHPNGFFNTSDFVEFLNNKNFEVIVSAYPEPHPDSKGFDFDLQLLKNKSESGAKKAITQFCFSKDDYEKLIETVLKENIEVEVIPGIMPIYNIENITRMAEKCGTKIPPNIINKFGDDDISNQKYAIEICNDQLDYLSELGCQKFHFYTLNKSYLINKIFRERSLL
jgi:methylenetetrahydrofolate reductase (NADPH)